MQLGINNFGENKHQEVIKKIEIINKSSINKNIKWHFIGQLQSNKIKHILNYANCIHSIDRDKIVKKLNYEILKIVNLQKNNYFKKIKCFIQINLLKQEYSHRGGIEEDRVLDLANQIHNSFGLKLMGLMVIAPICSIENRKIIFKNLQRISRNLVRFFPKANKISSGMSSDFREAIMCGATHIRIGSSIFKH